MRVAFITGSYPPDVCGVGDYTHRLIDSLHKASVDCCIYTRKTWALRHSLTIKREISWLAPDVIHIQYPTQGYNGALGPHALPLLFRQARLPVILTLHEFSVFSLKHKLVVATISAALADGLIFTTHHEKEEFFRFAPWVRTPTTVIPIGSNIPFRESSTSRDPLNVLYFGLIQPGKGLEEFIELARLSQAHGHAYRFTAVGKVSGSPAYGEALKASTEGLPVTWELGLDLDAVAERLSRGQFAYLPFPDGASERRGSLLAALGNGVVAMTTQGPHTTTGLKDSVFICSTPTEALSKLVALQADTSTTLTASHKGQMYARRRDWAAIAQSHVDFYDRIFRGTERSSAAALPE